MSRISRRSIRTIGGISGVVLCLATAPGLASQQDPQPAPAASRAAIVSKYCVSCHNERSKSGGLALDQMDYGDLARDAGVWEKAIKKVRVGMMPPQGAPQPDAATRSGAGRLAGDVARPGGGRQTQSGTSGAASAESRRVRERDPRSAGARRRSVHAAAARRLGVRVRQHRRRARRVAGAARALHGGGEQGRRAGDRRSRHRHRRRDIPHPPGRVAGHAHRRPADRHGRRHPREGHAAARRRVPARR